MNPVKTAVMALFVLAAPCVFANDCTLPTAPELPDGKSADMDTMLAGKEAVTAFQAANSEYLGCLNKAIEASKTKLATGTDVTSLEAIKAEYKALNEQYNSAIDAEEALANKFNDAIRAFKEANPS